MNLRRVLVLADESADWVVAGLRQLDRIALALEEFAEASKAAEPMVVCISWRPDVDQAQRWIPTDPRLPRLAFNTTPDDTRYDLVLSTRLFLYRKVIGQLIEGGAGSVESRGSWDDHFERAKNFLPGRAGIAEWIPARDAVEAVEMKFLRQSGKSQDGLVSRYLNRPLSRLVTRSLLPTRITPNAWTWLIFPIAVIAAFVLARGSYWSFVAGLVLFHIFSVLDGCDGEIARAKFLESERGRQLDDLFDVLSTILLVLGLGFGLRAAHDRFAWLFLAEGIAAAVLVALNEWFLARAPAAEPKDDPLGGALYPRHRALVARSGILAFGEKFAGLLIQLTKRDVAVLFFVALALVGVPSLILHLQFAAMVVTLALAVRTQRL